MDTTIFLVLLTCLFISQFYLTKFSKIARIIISALATVLLAFLLFNVGGLIVAIVSIIAQIIIETFLIKEEKESDSEDSKSSTEENNLIKRNNLIKKVLLNVLAILFGIVIVCYFEDLDTGSFGFVETFFSSIIVTKYTLFLILAAVLFLYKPCNEIVECVTGVELSKQELLVSVVERMLYLACMLKGYTYSLSMLFIVRAILSYKSIDEENKLALLIQVFTNTLLVIATYYILTL